MHVNCVTYFPFVEGLNMRGKVHNKEKEIKCEVCSRTFAEIDGLKIHTRTHNTFCRNAFAQMTHLESDTRTHTVDKSFKCNLCYKAFVHKNNLDRHKRIHSGEKLYRCNICHNKFDTEDLSEKPYKNPHWRKALQVQLML